jgi:hypothetical protein
VRPGFEMWLKWGVCSTLLELLVPPSGITPAWLYVHPPAPHQCQQHLFVLLVRRHAAVIL